MTQKQAVPGMAQAGVVLGQPKQQALVKSKHVTDFHLSTIGIFCILNDETNLCEGYQIVIHDQVENHTYNFKIDNQEVWDEVINGIPMFPPIGEVPDEEAIAGAMANRERLKKKDD